MFSSTNIVSDDTTDVSSLVDTKLLARAHPSHWIGGAVALAALLGIVWSFAHAQVKWSVVPQFLFSSLIIGGFERTIVITVLAMIMGLVLGTVFAVMRMSNNPILSTVAWLYVWAFRGTPILVQLLLWFNLAVIFPNFAIPGIWHVQTVQVITPFIAALLGLGINEGAYLAEIVRGGIVSVDSGQTLAAMSLGLSRRQSLRKIVLPQAMPTIIPMIGNETISMLKTSSLAMVIGYQELLQSSESIYFVNNRIMELLFVASIWYLGATSVASIGQYYLERRFGRSQTQRRSMVDRVFQFVIAKTRRASK